MVLSRVWSTLRIRVSFISVALLLLLISLGLGFCYHLLQGVAPQSILRTQKLDWTSTCQRGYQGTVAATQIAVLGVEAAAFAVRSASPSEQDCRSDSFTPNAAMMAFEFAGYPNFNAQHGVFIEQLTRTGEVLKSERIALPKVFPAESWKRVEYFFPSPSADYRIRLKDRSEVGEAWIALRPSIELFTASTSLREFRNALHQDPWPQVLQVGVVLLFIVLSYLLLKKERAYYTLFAVFLFESFFIHYRQNLFFCDDEWQLLARFAEHGWQTALLPHNEHFIPLFLLSYFGQKTLWGNWYDGYVLCTLVLHALNAVVLSVVVRRFLIYPPGSVPPTSHAAEREVSRTVSCSAGYLPAVVIAQGYLLSGLHAEMLQWPAVQGLAWVILLELCCLLIVLSPRFAQRIRFQLIAAVCAFSAPLFFASGILVAVHTMILAALWRTARWRLTIFLQTIAVTVALVLYRLHLPKLPPVLTTGVGPTINERALAVFEYFSTAFFGGTLLRGIGVSRAMTLDGFAGELPSGFLDVFSLSIWLVLIGSVFLILVLSYYLGTRQRNSRVLLALFALVVIASTLALPALGRYMLGPQHGLTFRYHSYSLLGLSLLFAPLISDVLRVRGANIAKVLFTLLAGLFFYQQLSLSRNYTRFWREGVVLSQWYQRVAAFEQHRQQWPTTVQRHFARTGVYALNYDGRGKRRHPRIAAPELYALVPTHGLFNQPEKLPAQ